MRLQCRFLSFHSSRLIYPLGLLARLRRCILQKLSYVTVGLVGVCVGASSCCNLVSTLVCGKALDTMHRKGCRRRKIRVMLKLEFPVKGGWFIIIVERT